ncbi:MAG TPA: hypothetical protein VGO41_02885 [Steroidobacteraceae bacterium]|jgi:hypothetical protein|nr:hypothetical protein [Steroidobacteraceae bacterium]
MVNVRALLVTSALALAAATGAMAADATLAGTWNLKIVSPQGTRTPSMTLTQNGTQLTGTYKGMRDEVPISGTVTGNEFTLTVQVATPDAKVVIQYKGTVDGAAMQGLVMMGQLGEANFTGTRAN